MLQSKYTGDIRKDILDIKAINKDYALLPLLKDTNP